jgi:cytochrome c-type biogenesis protein CcmH
MEIAMVFWIVAALLTLAASLAVLAPLARRAPAGGEGSHDLEVYKDQLAEVDRDAGRGLIQPAEAEEAKTEIARRILRLGNADEAGGKTSPARRSAAAIGMAAVLAVPLVSWGLYLSLGSPDLPSQPLAERLARNPADSSIDELVARAEAHLAANPDDGRGWDVLAPIYLRMGRAEDAVAAYTRALRLQGDSAGRQAGLGEAVVSAAGGVVSVEAQQAFERALALEPGQPKARFYLAMGLAQDGKSDEAAAGWHSMVADLPADSPWRRAAEQALSEVSAATAEPAGPGPSKDEVAAAAAMSDADRRQMIETMVAGLDEKLRANPKDAEGWRRLVRSYMVLGRRDDASDALRRGLEALGTGTPEAVALAEASKALGLGTTE